MKRMVLCIVSLVILGFPGKRANAISTYGGNGLIRVSSANTVYKGDLWANLGIGYTQGSLSTAGTYRDGQGTFSLLYGVTQFFEVGINQVWYQDQALFGDPGTGPLRFSLKAVLPTSAPSNYNVGFQIIGSFPTGSRENVELEPYYSDKTSIGGLFIFTIDTNPIDLRRSKRFHINVGYYNHNDKNSSFRLTSQNRGKDNKTTQQLLFGLAGEIPIGLQAKAFVEVTGESFLENNPFITPAIGDTGADARDYVRVTPGFRYQFGKVAFQTAVDLRLSGNDNFGPDGDFVNVYPSWRIHLGLQYRLAEGIPPTFRRGRRVRISGRSYYGYGPGTISSRSIGPGVIQSFEERQELLNQIEQDLQDLREQRIRAQRELEDLKKSLESTAP